MRLSTFPALLLACVLTSACGEGEEPIDEIPADEAARSSEPAPPPQEPSPEPEPECDGVEIDGICRSTRGCPANAYRVSLTTCRCVPGYVSNAAGTACVLPEEASSEPAPEPQPQPEPQPEPEPECPAGHPKLVINGELILCCPDDAEGVSYSNGTASCRCADGETWSASANTCS